MRLAFYASRFFNISDITFQRLSSLSNYEINISVVPWSGFLVFNYIINYICRYTEKRHVQTKYFQTIKPKTSGVLRNFLMYDVKWSTILENHIWFFLDIRWHQVSLPFHVDFKNYRLKAENNNNYNNYHDNNVAFRELLNHSDSIT